MKPRHITFAGKSRPVYFGFNAIWQVEKDLGIPLAKVGEALQEASLEIIAQFLLISLKEGARKEGVEFDGMTITEVFDGIDDVGMEGIEEIITVIASFLVKEEDQTTTEGGDDKPGE
jgi:hypothetical protein